MAAYLLIVLAVLSRTLPHPALFNFTAVGGSLLYFGARRPLREMWLPVAALALTDYYLTVFFYGYAFHVSFYLLTWAWYGSIILLGRILLAKKISLPRFAAGILLAPTSFYLITNFAAWVQLPQIYPRTVTGLGLSYLMGIPFYRNDLVSTAIVTGLAFCLPMAAQQFAHRHEPAGI
jgi:hypothetical protein